MKRPPAYAWVRFAVITATVLCAHAGLSGTAAASCGDYVSVGGSHSQTSHEMPPTPKTSAPTDPAQAVPPGQCRGPSCGKSESPLTPPLTPVNSGSEAWACWWLTTWATAPTSARLRPDNARSAPINHLDPIFHPPRPH